MFLFNKKGTSGRYFLYLSLAYIIWLISYVHLYATEKKLKNSPFPVHRSRAIAEIKFDFINDIDKTLQASQDDISGIYSSVNYGLTIERNTGFHLSQVNHTCIFVPMPTFIGKINLEQDQIDLKSYKINPNEKVPQSIKRLVFFKHKGHSYLVPSDLSESFLSKIDKFPNDCYLSKECSKVFKKIKSNYIPYLEKSLNKDIS